MAGIPRFYPKDLEGYIDSERMADLHNAFSVGAAAEIFISDDPLGRQLWDYYVKEAVDAFKMFSRMTDKEAEEQWRDVHSKCRAPLEFMEVIGSFINGGKAAAIKLKTPTTID